MQEAGPPMAGALAPAGTHARSLNADERAVNNARRQVEEKCKFNVQCVGWSMAVHRDTPQMLYDTLKAQLWSPPACRESFKPPSSNRGRLDSRNEALAKAGRWCGGGAVMVVGQLR
jgi:hypothetical protein